MNSNGRTNGITLPSADGQEEVIRKAYAKAQLDVNCTDYVEVSKSANQRTKYQPKDSQNYYAQMMSTELKALSSHINSKLIGRNADWESSCSATALAPP